MSPAVSYSRGVWAVLVRDWTMFISYRGRLITQIVGTFFTLALMNFFSKLVHVSQFSSPAKYFAFAVVGVMILHVLTSTLGTPPSSIRQELVAGTFERLVLSPMGAVTSVVSMMIFPLMFAYLTAIFTVVIAAVAFGLSLHWVTVALAAPVALLGAVAFAPFGIVIAAATLAFKRAVHATSYVIGGVTLVAGFYFPVTYLPHWVRWMSDVQPFTPAVELMRHLLVGTPLAHSAWLDVAKLAGFAAVLFPISLLLLSAAVSFGRKRGTITEY